MPQRVRILTTAVACAAALVTVLASAFPSARLAFENLATHVAVDTGEATIAVLVGYLLVARFRRRGRLSDLLLVGGLLVAAVGDLAFGAIPTAGAADPTRFGSWAAGLAAVVAAAAFAGAAATRDTLLRDRRNPLIYLFAACALIVAVIAATVGLLDSHLPQAISADLSPTGPMHHRLVGNGALRGLALASAVLSATAVLGFVDRALEERDELVGWVAVFLVLASAASLNWFLFPSIYSHWVYLGDYLMFAAYLALLYGAARELAAYQREASAAAVLEERRRLARELHDGLAQELAFISTQTRRLLDGNADARNLERLALAAERALDESRSAIAALTRRLDEPLEVAVAQAAEDVAERVGISVRFALEAGIDVPPATREALLRIVREAVSNTARHGQATQVVVSLSNRDGVRLRITDDGVGFDASAPAESGFGLVSMRERAEALGAELVVESRPGAGTEIEVVIP